MSRLGHRVGAVLAIVGGVVALVGNALAPRTTGDDVDIYREVADSTRFAIAGAIVLVAVILVTAAFVSITRSDLIGPAAEVAFYGRLAAVVGGSMAILQSGLALYGYRQQARLFRGADAHNVVSAFWATSALDHISSALFATWTLVFLGVAPILIGAAQLQGHVTGRLGLGAVVGGAICVFVGFASLLKEDQSTYDIPFAIGSVIVTLWLLMTGIVWWRRTRTETEGGEAPASGLRTT